MLLEAAADVGQGLWMQVGRNAWVRARPVGPAGGAGRAKSPAGGPACTEDRPGAVDRRAQRGCPGARLGFLSARSRAVAQPTRTLVRNALTLAP